MLVMHCQKKCNFSIHEDCTSTTNATVENMTDVWVGDITVFLQFSLFPLSLKIKGGELVGKTYIIWSQASSLCQLLSANLFFIQILILLNS